MYTFSIYLPTDLPGLPPNRLDAALMVTKAKDHAENEVLDFVTSIIFGGKHH